MENRRWREREGSIIEGKKINISDSAVSEDHTMAMTGVNMIYTPYP